MAKKVILKDLNEIEILPITRGELVLDSSGKKAFHSEEFLATSSLPGLMSKTDKTKVDNATTLGQAIPYIVGNASDSAGTWTGSYTGINEYTDGLTIIYVPKVAGASTTTLNINNLGAKTCYYTGTSKLTTHYAANTPILLTYLGGYWKRADYNVDTYTSAYSVTSGGTAGKTASCSGYQLKPNSYVHITFTNTNTYLGALTLNINTRGAKPIWINRNASSSSNYELPAGTYLAYYDGSSYHIRTDGTLPGIIEDSYGAKYISLYVNTTSSATTSKDKYYKFATINLTDANWSECSINFLFASIENAAPNGLLTLVVRRGNSITSLLGALKWTSLDDELYKDSVVLCDTATEGVYDLYFQPKKDYRTVRITAITSQYTKLQMFKGGYFEEVTPRITSTLSGYVHHAEKITCTESTSNKDYPIISTYDSSSGIYESLLYNPNITLNPSTGVLSAKKFNGKLDYTNLIGSGTTADLVIVSTGTVDSWTLKTLGSNAFDSTKYLPLTGGTLTGLLTLGSNNYTQTIKWANSDYPQATAIAFIGGSGDWVLRSTYKADGSAADLRFNKNTLKINGNTALHSGNYTSYTPILNSTSTHATSASVIYAPTSSGEKGSLLTSNGSGSPVWKSPLDLSISTAKTLDYIQLPSSTTHKDQTVWCKFATVTVNNAIYNTCSGYLLFSSGDNYDHCAIVHYYFRSTNDLTKSGNRLLEFVIKTTDKIEVIAVEVEANVYDLYVNNYATWTLPVIYNLSKFYSKFEWNKGSWVDVKPLELCKATDRGRVSFASYASQLNTRKLWGLNFDGTEDVKGSLSDVVSIIAESGKALTLSTPSGSNSSIYLRYNGDDTKSVCLISSAFVPTTASSNILNLGSASNKWKGVYAGTFYGNLSWNYITDKPTSFTPTAHTHNELTWTGDVRNVATQPSDYKKVFKFVGIKSPSVVGLTEAQAGYWVSLIGWKGYNDNSGPYSWELASTNKERIYVRSGIGIQNSGSGNEDWKEWHNIAYTTDNFPSNQITSLTGYSKATSAADLATTDTLNVALGKLEYKAHYAYNWINTVTDTDLDEYINKWGEIVDFLDSVKEGTDILEEFVTVKTAQTISGQKTFSQPVLIKNENDRLTKIYSESQTEGVPKGDAGTVIQGGNFSHRLLLKDSFAGGCNYASLSGGYNHNGKLILNSFTIDTTAVTATVKSTTIISTAASSLGGSLSINGDLWFPAVDNNRFINFTSKSTTAFGTYSWRLGYWGTGYTDENYFMLQSTTNTTNTWKNAFRITNETLFTEFYGNVKSTKFITSGGTASQFVKGDGSLDSTSYATSASLGNYLPLAGGTMTGNVVWKEGTGTGSRFPGHIYRNFLSTNGNVYDHFYPLGTTLTSNAYIRVWDGTTQSMRALLLAGAGSMKWCDNEVLHVGNYSNYLPIYDGTRMDKNTEFYKRYITVNGTSYAFVSKTNSSTSATIYAHTSVDKDKLSYSTASGLSYTALKYLKFTPNDNGGGPLYLLIADLTNWVKGTYFSTYLIGTMYGQRAGNLARSVVYNICAHMTSYPGGSQWTLYTDIYNLRVLQPYVVIYNGTKYLALKKNGSLDNVYFVGLAAGLLDTYIHVPCPNNTDLPEGLTIACSPTTTSMYIATTKVWDGTNVRDIIHSGNYTTYSGYIGTTKVQATGAELSLTGIKNITATGNATIKGYVYLGNESASNLFFTRPSAAYIWATGAGGYLSFGVNDVGGTGNTNASLVILAANVLPGMRNDAVELGSSSYRWKNVYSKLGNFLNQVLIGPETTLKTDFILNIYGNTYQRGEVKITNDTHGLRLLGHGGAGYLLFGHTSDTTAEHYGHITGTGGVALTRLDLKATVVNIPGRVEATGFLKTGSSDSYLLLGGGGHKAISSFYWADIPITTSATTNKKPTLSGIIFSGGSDSFDSYGNFKFGASGTSWNVLKNDGTTSLMKITASSGNMTVLGSVTAPTFIGNLNGDITKKAPLLCEATESDNINIVENSNGAITNNYISSLSAIRKAIQFRWYNTYWQIGNVRGGASGTDGFGVTYGSDTLCFRVTDTASYVYGNMYAVHFYESSDKRLKTNIQEILNSDKMPAIKEFDWKEDGSHSYGLIAQELEEQGYSELVSTKDNGYKTVNYSAALSLIVGKLQVKIKELEKEIEILKTKNL